MGALAHASRWRAEAKKMGIRTIGRWLYHGVTSAEKRPYIKLSLDDLERLTEKATSSRDIPLLFDAFDELRYRITSPDRRDRAITQIALLLQEFEGIHIPPDADHNQIAEQKEGYFSRLRERDQEEKRRRVSEAKAKRVAEQAGVPRSGVNPPVPHAGLVSLGGASQTTGSGWCCKRWAGPFPWFEYHLNQTNHAQDPLCRT
jgi:hypothetical protein